jgi:hypothetical protein
MYKIGWSILVIAATLNIECKIITRRASKKVNICSGENFEVYALTFL